jgi:ABC-type amino acid transport substrate-binding protein
MIGREWQLVPYKGTDFNGIFAGLDDGSYACIASGTTITPERSKAADFCPPYAVSGQSLVADVSRHPNVHGIGDLKGLVIGVQSASRKGIRASPSPTSWLPSIAPRACGSMPMTKSKRRSMICRVAAATLS